MERSEVARLVEKYLATTGSQSATATVPTQSLVLRHGGVDLQIAVEPGVRRCRDCFQVVGEKFLALHAASSCRNGYDDVFILIPRK